MKKYYAIIGIMGSLIIILLSTLLLINKPVKNDIDYNSNELQAPIYTTIVEEGPLHEVVRIESRVNFDIMSKITIKINSNTIQSLYFNKGDFIPKGKKISSLSDFTTDQEYYFIDYENYNNITYIHLVPTNKYTTNIEIPQIDAEHFSIGDNVRIRYNREVYTGKITDLDEIVSMENTRSAKILIETDDKLIFNSQVEVELKYSLKENCLFLDNNVILFDGFNNYVYLVDKDGNISRKDIIIGTKSNTYTEILSGLRFGDIIGCFYV